MRNIMEDSLADTTFQDELNQPVINVPRACLAFARSIAYPKLDIPFYLSRIDALAESARQYIDEAKTFAERVDALSDFLFYKQNFRGNRDHFNDPRNSLLNSVMDRKLGIPISLTVLFVAVAQRAGLNAHGIGLPGHFIAGVYHDGSELLVDPFNAGVRLSSADCARLVRNGTGYRGPFQQKWLKPVRPTDLLARMLTTLCHAYIQSENWQSAIPVLQHLLMVQPETDFHLRDLGYLYLYNGSLRLSAQYLEQYLRRSPDASDFESVRSSLEIVAGRLALWN